MPLPTPNEIDWSEWSSDYKIRTPTFRLTPIEKPDMSSFLVHMTGKNEILSILQGENAPGSVDVPAEHGYLQASIPEYNQGGFDAPVVCFTESPTFALDFFRYRSFHRWRDDQRFGIGFDKSGLVARGVRPVIYLEEEVGKHLIFLYHQAQENDGLFSDSPEINRRLNEVIDKAYPFLFPLLHNHEAQGFMWEREWRHPRADGLVFSHQSIKIVCCPAEEEREIRLILGNVADGTVFIRAWREYDDITNYLRRQQPVWQAQSNHFAQAANPDEAAPRLRILIQQYKTALHSLDSYEDFIAYLSNEMRNVAQEKARLAEEIDRLESQLEEIEAQRRENQG